MQYSGLRPGFHDERHRAAFVAARTRWLAAGGQARCKSRAKHGGRCGGWALRGAEYCLHHAPNAVRRERRERLLARPKRPEQADRTRRRESARVQRVAWRFDRWTAGQTIDLGPRDAAFRADVTGLEFNLDRFSPATLDAARWSWLHVQAGRMDRGQFRDRLRWHTARDG